MQSKQDDLCYNKLSDSQVQLLPSHEEEVW